MMFVSIVNASITTTSTGGGNATTPPITGRVSTVKASSDFTTPTLTLATTRGWTFYTEATITTPAYRSPRVITHASSDGSPLPFSTTGGNAVAGDVLLAKDRVVCTIASGGANKTGTVSLIIEGTVNST
jgi:hypothetical protein